jgi:hypothetical protein
MNRTKSVVASAVASIALLSSAVTVDFNAGNDGAIRFAARDLERILEKVPGCIALRTDPAMDAEVWRFSTAADGTFEITGRDGMGIAYGVYTYLERHCGVSWFAPDTEEIPDFTGFVLPKPSGEGRPAFSYREMWQGDLMDQTWRLRNKESRRALYGVGIGMGSPRDNHTFDNYCRTLRKTHPELFDNGRPDTLGKECQTICMTDPRTRELVAEEMCRYIAKDRAAAAGKPRYFTPVIYDLSQSDGTGGQCMCPGCKRLTDAAGGTYAAANLAFVNAVAERVGRRYPDVLIQTFAYGHTQEPPTNDVRYADNVIVRYCRSWMFRPLTARTENGQMLKEWTKHGSAFAIWSYWSMCRGSAFPLIRPPKVMEEELRFCRDCGVKRYFLQTDGAFSSSFMFLKNWMFLKLAEDPDRDSAALTAKFMKGLYGPAERPMSAYLEHLIRVQEPTRAFLDRDFFEKVNAWLDEAELLAKDDPRALLHVRNERVIVDRSMYENLAKLRREGYSYDAAEVARRFAVNSREQVKKFSVNARMREKALARVEGESKLYAHFPVELPKRFAGLEVEDLHWNRCKGQRSAVTEDPDACAGVAFYNNIDPVHSLPFSCGYFHQEAKYGDGISFRSRADVPQDEKFHLYRLGHGKVYGGLYINYDRYWLNRYYVSTPGIIPEEWEIWVSIKFQGPNFVKGSTKENRVLFDRLLYVKNDDPLRGYRIVGSNLVCNARPVELKGRNPGLRFVHFPIGDVDSITNDLYVTGLTRIKGIDGAAGMGDPFGGLWALAPGGKNAFTIECANYVKGDSDWYRFGRVVENRRIRAHAAAHGAPLKLYYRVNLNNQPGTVFLKDLQVLPIVSDIKD